MGTVGLGDTSFYNPRHDSRASVSSRIFKTHNNSQRFEGQQLLTRQRHDTEIADFGLARIFQKDEHEANTGLIVGTYGYVPPEYAERGIYSTKYDVYSFGVLLLQIICGKKNTCLYGPHNNLHLLECAYEMWKDGKSMKFMDTLMDDTNSACKLVRCMEVALLCVQEKLEDRSSMLEVYLMLKNEIEDVLTPKRNAFSTRKDMDEEYNPNRTEEICSFNYATMSLDMPR